MNISPTDSFQIIYSLFQHEYLGYVFESFIVELNHNGILTLKHQNISSKNAKEFSKVLDDIDYQLIKLTDALHQDVILKKFSPKKITISEFFLKVYDPKKGDKLLQEAVDQYVEKVKVKFMELVGNRLLFIMGNDGNPTWKKVEKITDKVNVLFHFYRNETDTHYFPTLKCGNSKLEFQYRDTLILCNEPAYLLVDDKLYTFEKHVDGKKIRPFLNKKFITVPRNIEEEYYKKFVAPLIASFDVYAKGFYIKNEKYNPVPLLIFSEYIQKGQTKLAFFGNDEEEEYIDDVESHIVFELSFRYGEFIFKTDHAGGVSVSVEKVADSFIFHKVKRDIEFELESLKLLKTLGMEVKNGKFLMDRMTAFNWMSKNLQTLEEAQFLMWQSQNDIKRYFVGRSEITVKIAENIDWFDIYAIVRFGEYEIPFLKLKRLIFEKKREFILPNGETAVIPEEWLTQYSELFAFAEINEINNGYSLKKYHLSLVQDLHDGNLAQLSINHKLESLRDFDRIEDYALPEGFKGSLRPYQKAGYNWMRFLNQYRFGGCLADDMGLGKTIQTLALLQSQKESGTGNASLIVLPTSLIYNWELESGKFTPDLKILIYTGTNRNKNIHQFNHIDIIITSYGIVRIDIDLLKKYPFNYVILDESQAIKNPSSNIAQSVAQLNAKHRLILTGTPLENNTLDLWSQMSFLNPGLLGTQRFFKNEFQVPIEKKNDESKIKKLFTIIKPFILRRHKSQVVKELPDKIESVQFCIMDEEQEKVYEEAKSFFRNKIIEKIAEQGIAKSQLILLQGLTALRQLANHPKMVNTDYEGESGKLKDVWHKLSTAISENHKILIFSQFVKHLTILRGCLDENNIEYAYLDGSTKDRQQQVELFQNNEKIQVFLLSLKAGGLGLNLTAADYVFILDPWWNPAIEAQAVDRAHRIGQKNTVMTYKFISKNTVEEKILALQNNKKRLFHDLISNEETFVKSLTKEDIFSLLD